MTTRTLAAFAAAAIVVAGCTVGPDYARPGVDTPAAWRIDYPKAAEVANTKWWEQFGDPVLNELIETALRENRDIRVAAARVDQFLGALTSHAFAVAAAIGIRRRREPHAASRVANRRFLRAPIPISRCIRVRSPRRGRSISSVACDA